MTALLTAEGLELRFWRGQRPIQVLRGASLDLEAGEFGGIWGDRGAGKTTLAKVVAGVLTPDAGRVTFDGQRLGDSAAQSRLHAQIGLATRRGPEIEDLRIDAWIASAMLTSLSWRAALRRAHVVLEQVGVAELGTESWNNLSDGERMLVAIAQAIVAGPKLLIVDDPVAGLGASRRAEITELLHAVAREGVAVLMTAAELGELQGADRIWSLDDGRLVGPPARPMGEVVQLRSAHGSHHG